MEFRILRRRRPFSGAQLLFALTLLELVFILECLLSNLVGCNFFDARQILLSDISYGYVSAERRHHEMFDAELFSEEDHASEEATSVEL